MHGRISQKKISTRTVHGCLLKQISMHWLCMAITLFRAWTVHSYFSLYISMHALISLNIYMCIAKSLCINHRMDCKWLTFNRPQSGGLSHIYPTCPTKSEFWVLGVFLSRKLWKKHQVWKQTFKNLNKIKKIRMLNNKS